MPPGEAPAQPRASARDGRGARRPGATQRSRPDAARGRGRVV